MRDLPNDLKIHPLPICCRLTAELGRQAGCKNIGATESRDAGPVCYSAGFGRLAEEQTGHISRRAIALMAFIP